MQGHSAGKSMLMQICNGGSDAESAIKILVKLGEVFKECLYIKMLSKRIL